MRNRKRTSTYYSPNLLENLSESLGGVYGVSRQIAEKALFGPLALLAAAKSTLGALLEPLFGQFLEEVFCELRLHGVLRSSA